MPYLDDVLRITFIHACEFRFELVANRSVYHRKNNSYKVDLFKNYSKNHSSVDLFEQEKAPFDKLNSLVEFSKAGLSAINIILHLISFMIFWKWKKRPMRMLLLFLSINEVIFSLCNVAAFILPLANTLELMKSMVKLYWIFIELDWLFGNGSLIMRNWSITLIAFARWEAIRYPLKPNKIFAGKSLNIILITIGVIGILYGFIRTFEYKFVFCMDTKNFLLAEDLLKSQLYKSIVLNAGFLLLQGFVPVLSVLILSIGLIHQIYMSNGNSVRESHPILARHANLRLHFFPSLHRDADPPTPRIHEAALCGRNRASDEFKTRTVLVLCLLFFMMEIPQSVWYSITTLQFVDAMVGDLGFKFTTLLLSADSLSNFWLYAASNKNFRSSLTGMFCCSRRRIYSPALEMNGRSPIMCRSPMSVRASLKPGMPLSLKVRSKNYRKVGFAKYQSTKIHVKKINSQFSNLPKLT